MLLLTPLRLRRYADADMVADADAYLLEAGDITLLMPREPYARFITPLIILRHVSDFMFRYAFYY